MSWCRNQDVVSQMWGNITFSLENSNGQKWIWHTGKWMPGILSVITVITFFPGALSNGLLSTWVWFEKGAFEFDKMLQFKILTAPLLERCSQPTLQAKEVKMIFSVVLCHGKGNLVCCKLASSHLAFIEMVRTHPWCQRKEGWGFRPCTSLGHSLALFGPGLVFASVLSWAEQCRCKPICVGRLGEQALPFNIPDVDLCVWSDKSLNHDLRKGDLRRWRDDTLQGRSFLFSSTGWYIWGFQQLQTEFIYTRLQIWNH